MINERVKSTVACTVCRKRKIRCSGASPCVFCNRHGHECIFIEGTQKRGRRPKQQPQQQQQRVFVEEQSFLDCVAPDELPEDPTKLTLSVAACRPEEPWLLTLQASLAKDTFQLSNDVEIPLTSLCHLLRTFETHVNGQQTQIIQMNAFLESLFSQQVSPCLVNAILAISMKFSSSRMVKALQATHTAEYFSAMARRQVYTKCAEDKFLDRIQCFCILSLYEFMCGDGIQAWQDTNSALILVQLFSLTRQPSPQESSSLNTAKHYLYIASCTYSLGYPTLASSAFASLPVVDLESNSNDTQIYALLHLLGKLQLFVQSDFVNMDPPPWRMSSKFMEVREELDAYAIRFPESSRYTHSRMKLSLENGTAGEYIFSILACQCNTILLNRVFLPVVTPTEQEEDSKTTKVINFPGAPEIFLTGRICAAEAAAEAITSICAQIVTNSDFFLPSFMGWALYQSSLILINQIQRCTLLNKREHTEKLKINLSILSAMSSFCSPAALWLESLGQIYKDVPQANPSESRDLFRSFFARYTDAQEPPFSPMKRNGTDGPPTFPGLSCSPASTGPETETRVDPIQTLVATGDGQDALFNVYLEELDSLDTLDNNSIENQQGLLTPAFVHEWPDITTFDTPQEQDEYHLMNMFMETT